MRSAAPRGSALLRRVRPQAALGWCQILLGIGMAWTALAILYILPPAANDVVLSTKDSWAMYGIELRRCLIVILPATLFWGASFPFACAAVARPGDDSGRAAGGIYAANTLGGIAGALLVSLILIPWIGSQQTERLLLVVAVASGLVALLPVMRRSASAIIAALSPQLRYPGSSRGISPIPGELIAYGRFMNRNTGSRQILYTKKDAIRRSPSRDGTTARFTSTSTATSKRPPKFTT